MLVQEQSRAEWGPSPSRTEPLPHSPIKTCSTLALTCQNTVGDKACCPTPVAQQAFQTPTPTAALSPLPHASHDPQDYTQNRALDTSQRESPPRL